MRVEGRARERDLRGLAAELALARADALGERLRLRDDRRDLVGGHEP